MKEEALLEAHLNRMELERSVSELQKQMEKNRKEKL